MFDSAILENDRSAAPDAFAEPTKSPGMSELKHQVMLANHYLALSEAADDLATFELYHKLALHHLAKAHEHEADGMVVERPVKELRKELRKIAGSGGLHR
jgi:hypothetical protein